MSSTAEVLNPSSSKSPVNSENAEQSGTSENSKTDTTGDVPQIKVTKRRRKAICVSYSPDACFLERKFVVDIVRQLKENSLSEELWFDRDEHVIDSPLWFASRLEAIEKCKAALVILSDSYFSCPVSYFEYCTLCERQRANPRSVEIFVVRFSYIVLEHIPSEFAYATFKQVDLTRDDIAGFSLAEKISFVIASYMEDLERHASVLAPLPLAVFGKEFTADYERRKICEWTCSDLQEWLYNLNFKEFHRQNIAEQMVDGFLLVSLTDSDMENHLHMDSRAARKKLMQKTLSTLEKEQDLSENWHLKARARKSKPKTVYICYDPRDVRHFKRLKNELTNRGLQVFQHEKDMGRSKEEYVNTNGINIASCTYVLAIITEASTSSPFVFHEVIFADWLGKPLLTAVYDKKVWTSLRSPLKAILGERPAIDFWSRPLSDSLEVLMHRISSVHAAPAVVFEQSYLEKMSSGIRSLKALLDVRDETSASQTSSEAEQSWMTTSKF